MSTHSYTRLWTHLIWETLSREPMLDKRTRRSIIASEHIPKNTRRLLSGIPSKT